ncbi:MAG: DUF420 domain-containing protein [Planctomycetota bacterium]
MDGGFLGFGASLMLDFVVCALVGVAPLLGLSIYLVACRKMYAAHRALQLVIGGALLATVVAFEADMHLFHDGWEGIVNPIPGSPRVSGEDFEFLKDVLHLHMVFAVSTPVFWTATTVLGMRNFANPPRPNGHSWLHKALGRLAAIDLVLTSATGLAFYYFGFVAPTLA